MMNMNEVSTKFSQTMYETKLLRDKYSQSKQIYGEDHEDTIHAKALYIMSSYTAKLILKVLQNETNNLDPIQQGYRDFFNNMLNDVMFGNKQYTDGLAVFIGEIPKRLDGFYEATVNL